MTEEPAATPGEPEEPTVTEEPVATPSEPEKLLTATPPEATPSEAATPPEAAATPSEAATPPEAAATPGEAATQSKAATPSEALAYLCGMEEHVHAAECYDAEGNLICAEQEHTHDETCLIAPQEQIDYLCGLTEHAHDAQCYDAEGNLICTEQEHVHDEMCYPDEGCFCRKKQHIHDEACCDEAGLLICPYEAHTHVLACSADLRDLSEDVRRQAEEVIALIEEMYSADQIDERIMEYELIEDYDGEEAWLMEVYQQVFRVYRRYMLLPPDARERIVNRDKLLELEYIWAIAPMAEVKVAKTIAYNANMFTDSALFVVYAQSGDSYYAFDGNGNAIPISIDAQGNIIADTDNKNELLWEFDYQSQNTYLIRNVATGRYMHAYNNNGGGVTTTGAYSSVLSQSGSGVHIRSNSEYARLDAANRVFRVTSTQSQAAVLNFGVTYECYVWLDGTNGGLMSLGGADNVGFRVTDGKFVLPQSWESPPKYEYTLRGWYDVINKKYYAPGSEVEVTENMVFYADWVAATYNIGRFNSHVVQTESTNSFITTRLFDYNVLFNMPSMQVSANVSETGHSETWRLVTEGDTLNYIFRDWDSVGKASYPNNINDDNTNGDVNSGLYHAELGEILFGTDNSFDPATGTGVMGKQYIGKGDHLFQYGDDPSEPEHYGYYYYDSHLNAASYNKSAGRFYVYDYLERTSDSESNGRYADFLPFNSPYANTNGQAIETYTYAGTNGEYSGLTHYEYDAKYNTNGSATGHVATNYWFGMSSEIEFYLPNKPGTTDAEGNFANTSLYGDPLVFEFSGDDDVWVFVDGRLVLDLGGIHGDEQGSINFSTGEVYVNGERAHSVTDLNPGEHTLTLYYLERGSSLSNCKIRFNLSPRYTLTLQKEDVLSRNMLNGAEFSAFTDAACTVPAQLWNSQAEHDRGVPATNRFIVADGKADMWGFAAGNTYYIKETKPPADYKPAEGIIVMTLNNLGVASYDVIAEDGNLTGGYTVHGFKVNFDAQEAFLVITNGKNVEETTSIHVRKRWNDTLNHSGDSVTVYLVVDGVRIREEILNEANGWQFTWENMPKYYEDGVTEVQYTVQEGTVPGYIGRVERITEESVHTLQWLRASGFENGQTYLIGSYEGYLSASGGRISFLADQATAEANPAARWVASVDWNGIKLTNELGQTLYYGEWRFRAGNNPSNSTLRFDGGRFSYTSGSDTSYVCNLASDGTGTLNAHTYDSAVIYTPYRRTEVTEEVPLDGIAHRITNTPAGEDELVALSVIKEWDLGTLGSADMYEQLQIDVSLLENGKASGMTERLNLKNGWSATFSNLPKYDDDGELIAYTVREITSLPEWSPHYGEVTLVPGTNNHYVTTITNECILTYMLPETGGTGTHLYTLGGLLLMITAGILLYKKRDLCRRGGM